MKLNLNQNSQVNGYKLFLPFSLIISLCLMKFRIVGIPLSDLALFFFSLVFFALYQQIKISLQSLLVIFFILLCFFLSLTLGDSQSLLSSIKLIVPLLALLFSHSYFSSLNEKEFVALTKKVLLFLVYSQLIIVVLFYSNTLSFVFHLVEPGNINRDESGFRLNVYKVPFLGLFRFGSLFVEPSWFAFFTGFFLLLLFVLEKQQAKSELTYLQHLAIILAVILTLSFTALVFLLIAYTYRLVNKKHPVRLVILVPAIFALVIWVLLTNDYLAHRVFLIATGNDASFNARVFASWDKAVFILIFTDYLGAAPGKTIDLINTYFQINLSIQNAYLEALASTGILGFILFVLVMHFSWFIFPSITLQLPLIMALLVSSVVFTPIYWVLAFYLFQVALMLARKKQALNQ
ncbi:hypothetical protein [Alishewanella longhuensis]